MLFTIYRSKQKKIEDDGSPSSFELTTEVLMVRALERGLTLSDFQEMTVGMIIDYITTYNNLNLSEEEKEDEVRMATQADYDAF